MSTGRMEAFSDAVIAIAITVMVLELPRPEGASWSALHDDLPVLLAYVLSFVYLGIYWNNHHHMLQVTARVTGGILWANLHLLFWLSLIPFTTEWLRGNHLSPVTAARGGMVRLAGARRRVRHRAAGRCRGVLRAADGDHPRPGRRVGAGVRGGSGPQGQALAG